MLGRDAASLYKILSFFGEHLLQDVEIEFYIRSGGLLYILVYNIHILTFY